MEVYDAPTLAAPIRDKRRKMALMALINITKTGFGVDRPLSGLYGAFRKEEKESLKTNRELSIAQ